MDPNNLPSRGLTLTDIVAFWGALTGTLSLTIGYFSYKRDSLKIEVDIKRGWRVMNHPEYDPEKDYAVITVSNKGRRPVLITRVGYQFLKKGGGVILADSMRKGSRELTEGKSTEYLIEDKELEDFSEICFFAAYDGVNNAHIKYISPFYKRLFYWFLDFSHLKRKADWRKNEGRGETIH